VTSADHAYHLVRAFAEFERARLARSVCARRAHLELAELHAERAGSDCMHLRQDRSRELAAIAATAARRTGAAAEASGLAVQTTTRTG
jgi:hypothetical protein